eukprot:SAG31_NODE_2807_length_5065_cov_3.438180_6_plen_146_part_00
MHAPPLPTIHTSVVFVICLAGVRPFSNIGQTVPVQIEMRSKNGPTMVGAKITSGCNMQSHPSKCFGNTQAENLLSGIFFVMFGLALCLTPIAICVFCIGAFASMFSGSAGSVTTSNNVQLTTVAGSGQTLAQTEYVPLAKASVYV